MIDNLITEVTEAGWYIHSIHETADPSRWDRYQVSLRHRFEPLISYAQANNLPLALMRALDGILDPQNQPLSAPDYTVESVVDLRSILGQPAFTKKF